MEKQEAQRDPRKGDEPSLTRQNGVHQRKRKEKVIAGKAGEWQNVKLISLAKASV